MDKNVDKWITYVDNLILTVPKVKKTQKNRYFGWNFGVCIFMHKIYKQKNCLFCAYFCVCNSQIDLKNDMYFVII